MGYTVTTPPTSEPVSLEEAKLHLRVSHSSEDTLISGLIAAARQHIELVCEHALMPQEWTVLADGFEGLTLPGGNIRSVTGLSCTPPAGGADVTVAPAQYVVDATRNPARVTLAQGASWPLTRDQANVVKAVYQVGYANADAVPAALKAALLLIVGDLFENREAQSVGQPITPNATVDALLWAYRRVTL